MSGASEAERLGAAREVTRTLLFPDGVHRLVVLKSVYWHTFDQLVSVHGYSVSELQSMAMTIAREMCDDTAFGLGVSSYEHALRISFKATVKTCGSSIQSCARAAANDDFCQ